MAAALAHRDDAPAAQLACTSLMTVRDRLNMRRVNYVLATWAVVFLSATFLMRRGMVAGPPAWILAGLSCALAVIAMLTYVRFLRQADELLQRVQLEALSWGFGAAFVMTTSWRLLERAGAPHLDIDDALLPMLLAWVVGQIVATRRYS